MQTLNRYERAVNNYDFNKDEIVVTARFNHEKTVEIEGYGKFTRAKVLKVYLHGLSMELCKSSIFED